MKNLIKNCLLLLLPTAVLASNNPTTPPSPMSSLPLMAGFFLLFYFMILKPQNKRKKDQQNLLQSLSKGDEVSTTGGIIGKVDRVDGNIVRLLIASGVIISINTNSISSMMPKGTFLGKNNDLKKPKA